MIIDISGTVLIPGNKGMDCPGNGLNPDVECCCNECDYMLCCFVWDYPKESGSLLILLIKNIQTLQQQILL